MVGPGSHVNGILVNIYANPAVLLASAPEPGVSISDPPLPVPSFSHAYLGSCRQSSFVGVGIGTWFPLCKSVVFDFTLLS